MADMLANINNLTKIVLFVTNYNPVSVISK